MRIEDYPAQEPFTEIGARYHQRVLDLPNDRESHDIAYGDDPYQAIAVFPADQPNGRVLCFMHGGGWTNGYKEWMAFMAPALNAVGITFVSMGYRLAPVHVYPAAFDDACDALATAFRRVAEFGGDPNRLFVGGHSAGGHHSALMALRSDWQASRQLPADVIKGALPVSGTFRFGEGSGLAMRPRFLGPEDSGNEEFASPVNYVTAGAPPFLIAWGDEDFPHLAGQSQDIAESLRGHDVNVTTLVLEGCDHLGASYACGEVGGAWINAAARFMEESSGS